MKVSLSVPDNWDLGDYSYLTIEQLPKPWTVGCLNLSLWLLTPSRWKFCCICRCCVKIRMFRMYLCDLSKVMTRWRGLSFQRLRFWFHYSSGSCLWSLETSNFLLCNCPRRFSAEAADSGTATGDWKVAHLRRMRCFWITGCELILIPNLWTWSRQYNRWQFHLINCLNLIFSWWFHFNFWRKLSALINNQFLENSWKWI